MVFGHRGCSTHAPENTASAIREAIDVRASGIEVDVRCSRDGTPFLIHDYDLVRVAGRPERVDDMDAESLSEVEVTLTPPTPTKSVTRQTLISLEQAYLEFGAHTRWIVEVKTDARCVEELARLWTRVPPPAGSVVISFDRTLCTQAREMLPRSIGVGRLHHEGDVGPDFRVPVLEQTLEDGLTALALHHTHWDRRHIQRCQNHGLQTIAWTVNRRQRLRHLSRLGVDIIISDLPETVIRRLHRGRWPLWA